MTLSSIQGRLSLAAGSLAVTVAPGAALADVVTVRSPVSLTVIDPAGTAVWDVDGDGMAEFQLRNAIVGNEERVYLSSVGLNGRGFVGTDPAGGGILGVSEGFDVGPTLATRTWGLADIADRLLAAHTVTYSSPAFGFSWLTQAEGPTPVAFRFDAGSGLQYGWGLINVDLDGRNTSVKIAAWQYETDVDTPIQVGPAAAVSEPAAALPALALLGLGAAGVRTWRHRARQRGR